jgi:hypothetical protein
MSPTRRDVLKIAAALPVAAASMSRADALAELAKPVGVEPVLPDDHPGAVFDPASFADQLSRGTVARLTMDNGVDQAAAAIAAYSKARFALIQLTPELEKGKIPFDHPFVEMDECMWWIANDSYWEGVRAGAAYENLRRAVVARRTCVQRARGSALWIAPVRSSGTLTVPSRATRAPVRTARRPAW